MIIHKEQEVTTTADIVTAIECDRCHKKYKADGDSNDVFETQEFHHIRFTGGYASVFGDESRVECDLCQYCLKELIGEFARIS